MMNSPAFRSVLLCGLTLLSLPACSSAEVSSQNKSLLAKQELSSKESAIVEVPPAKLKNYVTQNVRIKSVKLQPDQYLIQHGFLERHTQRTELPAPNRYEVELLCERPLLLDFSFPKTELNVEPGCSYLLTCTHVEGEAQVIVENRCG